MGEMQLSCLINMDSPEDVLKEGLTILRLISPTFDCRKFESVFHWTAALYNGDDDRYRACNTNYHDFHHITDTFLAMARLIHGAILEGISFTDDEIYMGLVSALAHDTGYIQEANDTEGTGSKYTVNHVQRSMDFVKHHHTEYGLNPTQIVPCRNIILCTDSVDPDDISFLSDAVEKLGRMLCAADFLAQMADRTYLEKLLFLYQEFREAGINDYKSEVDLLKKTIRFYETISERLKYVLNGTHRYMTAHMVARWKINDNLYQRSIERNRSYLQEILNLSGMEPLKKLRRNNIVENVRIQYGLSENPA